MTTPTCTMPIDTPVGRLVLESDGDVLIGIWLPTSGMKARGDGEDAPALTHNPEVVGSNPTPATRQKGLPEIIRKALFTTW